MNVRGKVTPKLRARVLELRGAGQSYRAVAATLKAEGTPLSPQGVLDVCKGAEKRQERKGRPERGEQGAGRASGAGGAEDGAGEREGSAGESDEGGEGESALTDTMPELPEGASVAAVACWQDLREVRQTARDLRPKVMSGDYSATQWATLKGHALRLMKALHEMLPPPKPDPAKDPMNIGAREAVHAHVLRVIEGAEARLGLLCPRCRSEVEAGSP